MSTDDERTLIHRLAGDELDAGEEAQALALVARDPDLAALLEELRDLQARVREAFPEPPPLGDQRDFVELLRRLTVGDAGADAPRIVQSSRRSAFLASRTSGYEGRDLRTRLEEHRIGFSRELERRLGSPGAHLFHLREIARDDGLAVELEFYAGDVLAVRSEVLLLSAIAGSYLPTPGSVFAALADRYGISFASGPPAEAVRYPNGLLHFRGVSCPAFDSLWVVEMREPGQPFTIEDLRGVIRAIGGRLADMLGNGSSITLPLLGTGNQQLNPRDVSRELLSALQSWAQIPPLRTIRVVTLELDHIAILNRALDDRDHQPGNSAWSVVCDELRRRLEVRDWPASVRAALKDLLQIAVARSPSLPSLAFEGRRVAAVVLQVLAGDSERSAVERAAPITPDLQLLLDHGRAVAAGEVIDYNDAILIIQAALRAAERTLD